VIGWFVRQVLDHVTMLNQAVQRAQPPTRSSSLRCQSSTSSLTGSTDATTPSKPAAAANSRLAVELQRLHELKRQVAAQEQRLAALRTSSATSATLTDSNGGVGSGK